MTERYLAEASGKRGLHSLLNLGSKDGRLAASCKLGVGKTRALGNWHQEFAL